MRHVVLYLLGPLIVALLVPLVLGVGVLSLYPILVLGAVPVVLGFTLLVAVPLFAVAARKLTIRAPLFGSLAFIAGFVSFLIFALVSTPHAASIDGVIHAEAGQLTAAGWRAVLKQSTLVGLASVPGGVIWWLAARKPLEGPAHDA